MDDLDAWGASTNWAGTGTGSSGFGGWAQFAASTLGDVAKTYANYTWNSNPNVIQAKALGDSGYYTPGQVQQRALAQGGISVSSDVLLLVGLGLVLFLAAK